ncbi:Cell division cycle protein 123 [Abortiporus biennis]
MPSPITELTLFPTLTRDAILSFQFSSWYPKYSSQSIKSTIIRPLDPEFKDYLDSEGVFIPEGAEDTLIESTLSDDEDEAENHDDSDENEDEPRRKFSFPELDAKIRAAISKYTAVFPKLNFSSPRDAAWMLPASSPMRCTSPADVYLLLKSSDFILHDLDPEVVFEETVEEKSQSASDTYPYQLELILRKWYPVDHSRELRCFVRRERLIGISQRDPNYYDFWNETTTQRKVLDAVTNFWETNIKGKWEATDGNYVFDILLTVDLTRAHIIDFNPYAPRTDPLLFTYDELQTLALKNLEPTLRVIDSRNHPAATRNAPAHQHNMVPLEALALSQGRSLEDFTGSLQEEIMKSTLEDDMAGLSMT